MPRKKKSTEKEEPRVEVTAENFGDMLVKSAEQALELSKAEVVASDEAPEVTEEDLIQLEEDLKDFIVEAKLFDNLHDRKHITARFIVQDLDEDGAKSMFNYSVSHNNYINTEEGHLINTKLLAKIVVTSVTPV